MEMAHHVIQHDIRFTAEDVLKFHGYVIHSLESNRWYFLDIMVRNPFLEIGY